MIKSRWRPKNPKNFGTAKILDFGLAKLAAEQQPSWNDSTLSEGPITNPGMVLGTLAYMSPEQVLGEPLDPRSDLFSFGVVFYEMATGSPPFTGETCGAVFDAILHQNPIASLPQGLGELKHIIGKCLEKDPGLRYQHASEIRADLERLKRDTDSARAQTSAKLGAAMGAARRWKAIVSAVAVLAALTTAGYFYFHRTPKLTDRDTIVLTDFTNQTGDPIFDETLRQGLAVQLEQSPFLSLVSDERIQRTLRLMSQPSDARLTPALARDICERTAGAAVLEGSIVKLGSVYVLGLRATSCHTGNVLDEEQAQAARKEDVLNALSQIASTFRTRVGESLATVEKHETPLAEATTPSLEALKAYSAGRKVLFKTGSEAAVPLFKRAIEIDPQFAMAHAFLGRMYADLGESALSAESTTRAYQLRDRASDAEKFFITATYDIQVTGNVEKAQRTCEQWVQTYPRDAIPHSLLSGVIYPIMGKYERAAEEGRKTIELDPDFAIGYSILAYSYEYLEHLVEAEEVLQQASTRKLEMPEMVLERYDINFLKGDKTGMEREAALGQQESGAEDSISYHQGFALAYSGHLQQARSMLARAADLAEQSGQPEKRVLFESGAALWEAFLGNVPEAQRSAMAAVKRSEAPQGGVWRRLCAGPLGRFFPVSGTRE